MHTYAYSVPLQRSRVRPLFVCLGASLSGLKDRGAAAGCKDSVQAKRVQVFDTWSEIQQLEEEIEKKMVSADATEATERRIRDVKVLGDELGTTALHLPVHVSNVVLSNKITDSACTLSPDTPDGIFHIFTTHISHVLQDFRPKFSANQLPCEDVFNARETSYTHGKSVQTLHILLPPHLLSLPGQNKCWKCLLETLRAALFNIFLFAFRQR